MGQVDATVDGYAFGAKPRAKLDLEITKLEYYLTRGTHDCRRCRSCWVVSLNRLAAWSTNTVMSMLTYEEIARLSPPERLALIGDLWDSLSDAELPLAPAQRVELERRMESFERDRAGGVTWEQMRAELAARAP
jgi:putative addiction module component (TIGR02574 family)